MESVIRNMAIEGRCDDTLRGFGESNDNRVQQVSRDMQVTKGLIVICEKNLRHLFALFTFHIERVLPIHVGRHRDVAHRQTLRFQRARHLEPSRALSMDLNP